MGYIIQKLFLLLCLILLLPVSASASFKGLHPPMEIEPELVAPPPPIELVYVKGGCYKMGDTFGDGDKDERPVHTVCMDDFYIGMYEVTQFEWFLVMGDNPSKNKSLSPIPSLDELKADPRYDDLTESDKGKFMRRYDIAKYFNGCTTCPVENVSWDDVQEFISKLNNKSGKNYRLPTEAEWEYAARSGGKKEKFAGFSDESQLYLYANFCDSNCVLDHKTKNQNDSYKETSPVGTYRSNGLGLYDMSGNVQEWMNDYYGEDYYEKSPKDNPKGPSRGKERAVRGGCWLNSPESAITYNRGRLEPPSRFGNLGFRLALSPK